MIAYIMLDKSIELLADKAVLKIKNVPPISHRGFLFFIVVAVALYMQAFHQHNILIKEQQVNDINPLYEFAHMSCDLLRIP